MLFHGLRSLLGEGVVDWPRLWYMYESAFPRKSTLYGRGFSIYCTLPDIAVDRHDIAWKIRTHYYDFIIYGSVWRCRRLLGLATRHYQPKQVVFIDGEDHQMVHPHGKSPYFKRECLVDTVFPIHFAIPKSKFCASSDLKCDNVAPLIPGDRRTYLYMNEADYYKMYKAARFAPTRRKGGWDCLRHYEIIACGTVPLFADIESCPPRTMVAFPKDLCVRANSVWKDCTDNEYADLREQFMKQFDHLHTEYLAKYFLNSLLPAAKG